MLLTVPVPGTAVYNQATLSADATIPPSTANVALLSSGALAMTGRRTRAIFTAGVGISGTTNTLRLGTFTLFDGVTVVKAIEIQLPADAAAAGVYRQTVHIEYDFVPTPGSHTFTIQWKTGANTTLAIPATDPTTGYANLIIEELTAGTTFVPPTTNLLKIGCVQSNDLKSLLQAIRNDFAAKLTINAGMMFVDVQLMAGGAGATWEAMILYQLPTSPVGSVAYPLVSDLSVGGSIALEPITNEQGVAAIFGTDTDGIVAWSGAASGAGAVFAEVFIYIQGEGDEEGFAALRSSLDDEPSLASKARASLTREAVYVGSRTAKDNRRPPALSSPEKPVGVTFARATVAGRMKKKPSRKG